MLALLFALAVLAVIGSRLPTSLRTFLLTLAVVDDLYAITIIAVFFTDHLSVIPLLLALIPLAAFTVLVQRRVRSWWLPLPLAAATWGLVHASGVHATVAGLLLGFAVPAAQPAGGRPGRRSWAGRAFRAPIPPLSAGVAVPVLAFFSAGVAVGGMSGLGKAVLDPIALGIIIALAAGKALGIFSATFLVARFTHATLDEQLSWIDVLGLALLGGIGFTVSLLIGELAFGAVTLQDEHVKVRILAGSLLLPHWLL